MAHPKVKIDGTFDNFSISGYGSRDGKYRMNPIPSTGTYDLLKWDSSRMEYRPLQRRLRKDSIFRKFIVFLEDNSKAAIINA